MQTYRIDKGLQIPEPHVSRVGGEPGKAFRTMQHLKTGESFLVKEPAEIARATKALHDFHRRERQRGGKLQFVSRRVKGGVRIWRTS